MDIAPTTPVAEGDPPGLVPGGLGVISFAEPNRGISHDQEKDL
jgi:hypothetical protein